MRILYILSVISFIALIWAVVSITRHIRRSAAEQSARAANSTQDPTPNQPLAASVSARRDPVATRNHSDWANLEKSIGNHDLGNTDYPQAANRARPASTKL